MELLIGNPLWIKKSSIIILVFRRIDNGDLTGDKLLDTTYQTDTAGSVDDLDQRPLIDPDVVNDYLGTNDGDIQGGGTSIAPPIPLVTNIVPLSPHTLNPNRNFFSSIFKPLFGIVTAVMITIVIAALHPILLAYTQKLGRLVKSHRNRNEGNNAN